MPRVAVGARGAGGPGAVEAGVARVAGGCGGGAAAGGALVPVRTHVRAVGGHGAENVAVPPHGTGILGVCVLGATRWHGDTLRQS